MYELCVCMTYLWCTRPMAERCLSILSLRSTLRSMLMKYTSGAFRRFVQLQCASSIETCRGCADEVEEEEVGPLLWATENTNSIIFIRYSIWIIIFVSLLAACSSLPAENFRKIKYSFFFCICYLRLYVLLYSIIDPIICECSSSPRFAFEF